MDAKQFKQYREDLKLTQPQLAEKLGYNQSSISRAESGKLSKKLAKAFELLILNTRK